MADKSIPGFHYARAVLSIFVVLWHAHAVPRPEIWSAMTVDGYVPGYLDIINFQVLLVAVPGFVAISCFLFVLHGGGMQRLYGQSRRLTVLMLFWSVLFLLVEKGWTGLADAGHALIASPAISLVGAFGTVYYFFVALAATLVLTEVCCRRSSTANNAALLVAFCALIVLFQWIPLHGGPQWMSAHWNPLNYAPYAPAMALIARNLPWVKDNSGRLVAGLVIIAAVLAVIEWATLPSVTGYESITANLPAYTRLSLLPTSAAIVVCCVALTATPGRGVLFMSNNSLALYCLHPPLLAVFVPILGEGPRLAALAIFASYAFSATVLPRMMPRVLYR